MASDVSELKQAQPTEATTAELTRGGPLYTPHVDITENENEMTLVADMPGVESGAIDIQFDNGELTLYGKVEPRHEGVQSLYSEYGIGDYHRVFRISDEIDSTKSAAELKNGVLTVHLPKSEAVKPRKIEVQAK